MKQLFTSLEYNSAKSTDLLPLKCYHCNNKFYQKKFIITMTMDAQKNNDKQYSTKCRFCNQKCFHENQKNKIIMNCITCNKQVYRIPSSIIKLKNIFCSKSCSAKYNNTRRNINRKEINKKISETLKLKNKAKFYTFKCEWCGKENTIEWSKRKKKLCNRSCSSKFINKKYKSGVKGGQASAKIQIRRSKNEIYFAELCEKKFQKVLLNENIFNGWDADVIIEDFKVAVLWNGKWHYEKITQKHSIKQVQNRDKIKIKEIKKQGYIPYIIKDMGKYDKDFVELQFKKFIEIFA